MIPSRIMDQFNASVSVALREDGWGYEIVKEGSMRRQELTRYPGGRGFTFIEVLAALLFLAILYPAIVGGLTISNRASVISERTAVAAELAREPVE